MAKRAVSPEGYAIVNSIIRDFPPDRLVEFQQRITDVIAGIAIGMKEVNRQ